MNELLLHEQYVREHLDDRTAARALVDHHQEALDVSRVVALRAVAAIRKAERDSGEMAAAAAVMADQDGIGREVAELIREAGSEAWRRWATIVIVAGSRYPRFNGFRHAEPQSTYWSFVITIGARRVLMIAEHLQQEDDEHTARLVAAKHDSD